jgi:hypothetical protein
MDTTAGHGRLLHDCRPPTDSAMQIEDGTWMCPVCGDSWHVQPRSSPDAAHRIELATPIGLVGAEWIRGPATRGRSNGAGLYTAGPTRKP